MAGYRLRALLLITAVHVSAGFAPVVGTPVPWVPKTSCTVAGLATPVEGCRSCVNGTQRGQCQKDVVRGQIAYAVKWSLVSAGLGIVVILLKLLLH